MKKMKKMKKKNKIRQDNEWWKREKIIVKRIEWENSVTVDCSVTECVEWDWELKDADESMKEYNEIELSVWLNWSKKEQIDELNWVSSMSLIDQKKSRIR